MLDTKFILFIAFCFIFSCTNKEQEISQNTDSRLLAKNMQIDNQGLSTISLTLTTLYGKIRIKFYPQEAPKTVEHIVNLVQKNFYDNMPFHRVVTNMLVQIGDPTGSGSGGSGAKIKDEINRLKHIRGSVGMAKKSGDNFSDSQFYIILTTTPHLDGIYTIWGKVVDGLNVVEQIKQNDLLIKANIEGIDEIPTNLQQNISTKAEQALP